MHFVQYPDSGLTAIWGDLPERLGPLPGDSRSGEEMDYKKREAY